MHDPEHEDPIETVFVPQVTQTLHSSPSRIRGPRWRKKAPSPTPAPRVVKPPPPVFRSLPGQQLAPPRIEPPKDEFDDPTLESAVLNSDIKEMEAQAPASFPSNTTTSRKPLLKSTSFRQQTLFGTQAEENLARQPRTHNWPLVEERNEKPTHHKLDPEAMQTWVYPTNLGKAR